METLQFKNYRRFVDSGEIRLRPITLLVGSNSSGKSSFLKFFPLLKQSMRVNRNGTFLWYSNDVDFKDFKNTVHDGEGCIEIITSFNLMKRTTNRFKKGMSVIVEKNPLTSHFPIKLTLIISPKGNNEDYLKEFRISISDQQIVVKIDENENASVIINGREFDLKLNVPVFDNAMKLLPSIFETEERQIFSMASQYASNYFKNSFSSTSDSDDILVDSTYMSSIEETKTYLKMLGCKKDLSEANDIFVYMHLNDIIQDINFYFLDLSLRVTYVKPLRVSTERYYRYQNYAVNEIDSDGKNLAMYLANMTDKNMIKFTNWTSKLFGFRIIVLPHEGHVELLIQEGGNTERNLVDTGFGYTQLLPILTMIWNAMNNVDRRRMFFGNDMSPNYIVIEQPELHLHPRLQAKFGSMLAKVISTNEGKRLKFVIETHSEAILNSIGIEIENKVITNDKVNVVLFNASKEGLEKYIEEAQYNERGFIDHWPTGFLSENVY